MFHSGCLDRGNTISTVDTINTDDTNSIFNTTTTNYSVDKLNKLIELKFTIEKEISAAEILFKKISEINLLDITQDLDIVSKLTIYKYNINHISSSFLEIQKSMLITIENLLNKHCEHDWIYDIIDEPLERSRQICYCSKCFIYKKK